jgi:colanic acid biosynthesis glycosyl transferase WcaI
MNVLIVSPVFPPEPIVSAQTTIQIAEEMRRIGHTVTIVTAFPNRPAGKLYPGFSRKLVQREQIESGIEIVRCFSTLSPESRMFSRLLENLSFGLTSGWQALVAKRPQVVYANTWPILATGLLFLVAKLRRIPLVISVQDVYPEALMTQQRIKDDSFLTRFLRWIDGVIARHSTHVIVISERFTEIYRDRRRVPPNLLSLVPNWIDSNQIDVNDSGQKFRLRTGIAATDFLLVYGGNVGVAAGVETVIDSMRLLANEPCIRLLVAGSGSQLATCQKSAQQIPGQPVLFHSPWAAEETSEVLRAADVLVLPTQREQSLASVPSKLLSYMLAGRPVLATAVPGSDLANLLSRSQCGWVVEPDRPDLLAAQIKEVTQLDPVERQRRGNSGREYVLQHFAKDVCLPEVIRILEQAGR